ncbi:MAG: HDOD domain-containing protein [Planctomycetota bacterium]|jgi:HD-like signal output (HDOD) protein
MSDKIKILFVDDEPRILSGLRRMLHLMRGEWDMEFATGGAEALGALAGRSFDIIVSDMRMPGVDGVELLGKVQSRYPHIVRVALSGQASRDTVLRSIGLVHQYLAKPCDAETVKSTLMRICALKDLVGSGALSERLSQMQTIPSLPSIYDVISEISHSSETSINEIGQLVSQDLGMSARVMQLVSSAFFSRSFCGSGPAEAADFLGTDIVRAMLTTERAFSQFEQGTLNWLPVERITRHCRLVGQCAGAIANAENAAGNVANHAFIAGLLHDVGKIALAAELPEEYEPIMTSPCGERGAAVRMEREKFGATHAEAGAYLMGLWGLPEQVVEAIAFHHDPTKSSTTEFTPLTAVHAADFLINEVDSTSEVGGNEDIDDTYLVELNLLERVATWREQCAREIQKETTNV